MKKYKEFKVSWETHYWTYVKVEDKGQSFEEMREQAEEEAQDNVLEVHEHSTAVVTTLQLP